LAATFFYVFRDFIQDEVKALSEGMFLSFAKVTGHIILAVTAGFLAKALRRSRDARHPSLVQTAHLLGEEKPTLIVFQIAWWTTLVVTVVVAGSVAGGLVVGKERFLNMLLWPGLGYLTLGLVVGFWPHARTLSPAGGENGPVSTPPSLLTWRLKWWRNARMARLGFGLGTCAMVLGGLAAWRSLPAFVPAVCMYAGALLWTIPMAFQLAADLEVSWI